LLFRFKARLERLGRFDKGHNRYFAPVSLMKFSKKSSETLDKLVSPAREERRDLTPKD